MKPRFHAGKFMAFLKPIIIDLGASYESATKYFCIIQGSNKISRLVACLLHKIPTGLFLMTYAPGLKTGTEAMLSRHKLQADADFKPALLGSHQSA